MNYGQYCSLRATHYSSVPSTVLNVRRATMKCQSLVLGCATLTVVMVGVGILLFVTFLPLVITVPFLAPTIDSTLYAVAVAVQALHLHLLWTSTSYLAIFRRLLFPIRKPLMLLVFQIARIEAIREETPTLYLDLSTLKRTEDDNAEVDLLQSFRPSVRRRYKQMEIIFQQNNIRHEAVRSEEALNLLLVVPIMLEHERRRCQADGTNVLKEFTKRFLVVTMTTDALLDLYYTQDGELCCVQLSILQGHTLHWFMYFSLTSSSKCGIWYHGILNSMLRGLQIPSVQYINGQIHQTESKQRAGLVACEHTKYEMLSKLYPLALSGEISPAALSTCSCWASSAKREAQTTTNETSASKAKKC